MIPTGSAAVAGHETITDPRLSRRKGVQLHGSRLIPARGTKGMCSRTDVQKTSAGVGFQHIGQRRPILGGRLFDYLLALKWVMDVQKTSAGLGFQHIGRGGFSAYLEPQAYFRGQAI